ncbi:hypothetical protein [Flavilitoribacter nigricans]|uniref:CHAT domain-containing protein n=1 Tax=Flavilitoribacter nigricans (strain ATCC 23147 / DSM 23189 / NBRC 102662 / NCIMB 1420 / SS-2) TaxID=1122177 RepID=A0A2D0MX77_FLAN2|nr:hypothetical protein [Flavilitoribacter nigricans]PHN00758.1 hypothetical protein CRP01_40575 [Flavilitoribacter nigricans DSM 23189 = NBRC 102662]
MNVPEFNKNYICIVDRRNANLAAVISSYLQQDDTFLSVFEVPTATIGKPEEFTEIIDEHWISRTRGEELSIQIHNSIKKIGGCEYLIVAGLDKKQKSYFDYLEDYNTIEIDSVDEVDAYLGGIAFDKEDFLDVRPDEALLGLLIAGRKKLKLNIESTADCLTNENLKNSGLFVIENNKTTSVVSAINLALSMGVDIELINPLQESDVKEVKLLIEEWKNGDDSCYNELIAKLFSRINDIEFSDYDFATFFTIGAPYSLIIKNSIPNSYIHLLRYPNIFIVDSIYYENQNPIGSTVVFSPLEFGTDEETDFVIKAFKNHNFWVKELIGKNASVSNIDMHVKEYPYDLLHICSHGGEVNGFEVVKEFTDRDGNKHVIEYDDVISFQPERGQDLIKVEHKHIWRKFNGFIWKSEELEEQKYPNYVFSDMINAINSKKKYEGTRKSIIPDSCSIKCSDFIYQALFNMVAGWHTSPIIFNNTCWSWSGISEHFLDSGVRGYIGTLWAVKNGVAEEVAEYFYNEIFDNSIIETIHRANNITKGTNSEDTYIYWGLPFSTLKSADSKEVSRINITKCLMESYYRWKRRARILPRGTTRDDTIRLAKWNLMEIRRNFFMEAVKIIRK